MINIKRRFSVCVMAVLLSFLLAACSTSESFSSSATDNGSLSAVKEMGFDSPEDAAMAYLEGLRDADLNRMISAFAVEIYVKEYNFEASLNRLKSYIPMQEIKLPNTNEFVTSMNIENRRGNVTSVILNQYLFLCDTEFDQSRPHVIQDEMDANKFVAQLEKNLNGLDFQTLELVGFIPPEELTEIYSAEINQNNLARRAEVCGANKLVSCVAVFKLDGNEYLLCLDTIEYDGKWYIEQFGGNIGLLLSIDIFSRGILSAELYDKINLKEMIVPVE